MKKFVAVIAVLSAIAISCSTPEPTATEPSTTDSTTMNQVDTNTDLQPDTTQQQ
ncbi:MAG: hypothetical protein KF862_03500 [Chitinophagaceae bacterium]|nr:hypothetical protein [Chitinophagaceae bacterium]